MQFYINTPRIFDINQPKIAQNGYVTSHAHKILLVTPHLTADRRLVAPTPMIALLEVCVVLTGSPMLEAASITIAAHVFAEKP